MAMGFVVARFGLFLKILSASVPTTESHAGPWLSTALGTGMVLVGSLSVILALWNHRMYVKTLPAEDVPRIAMPTLASYLAAAVALCGFFLAFYLLVA